MIDHGLFIVDHLLPLYDVLNGQLLLKSDNSENDIVEKYLIEQN